MKLILPSPNETSDNIAIRAVEPSDLDAIIDIWSPPNALAGTIRLPFTSRTQSRKRLEESWVDREGFTPIVAEKDGRVVAFAVLARGKGQRAHAADLGIGVHNDFQGQGIGKRLMAALVDLADNWLSLKRLELTVDTDNEPALRLYKAFDFVIEGTSRAFIFRNGRYIDAFVMGRIRQE
jgi:putative acetyltransferase